MTWLLGFMAACTVAAVIFWLLLPRVPEERVADEDRDLVRERDRAEWRRTRLQTYKGWKRHHDFYRIAVYRKLLAGGASETEAKARVREDYPIFYLDPADRDTEGYTGDDGALPMVLHERVDRNTKIIKELSAEKDPEFRTVNALIRACFRKGLF